MQIPTWIPLRSTAFIALACLAILVCQGCIEWEARANQVLQSETSLANLASSLARQAESTIDIADTVLTMIVERIESDGTGPEALARVNRKLVAQIAERPRYRSVTVVDTHGHAIASSFPDNRADVSTREYFIHHRDDPSRGPYISKPIQSSETGHWILAVTRRINAADGSFAGVAFVSIELDYFANLYATYDLGPDSSIILSSTNGTLLAKYPPVAETIGKNFSNATVFSKIREHSAGSLATTSIVDHLKRFVGYRKSDRYPLLAIAAMSQDHALAAWRADAILHMAITLIMTIGVGLLGLHLVRQVRRSQTAEQDLRTSEQFLDRTGRLAGVGGWEVDLTSNEVSWSAETRRIYGLEPSQMPTLQQAIDFFAAEARPVITAAFERCVADGDGWDLELPFVRADGRALWVRTVGSVIRANGQPVRVAGALQDITERALGRLALETANQRVALAADSGRIGIWDWDIVNDTMDWDAWMFRLYGTDRPAEKLSLDLWREHLHPDDRAAAEQAVRDVIDGSQQYVSAFRVAWDDGSVHHIRGSGTVTRDAAGTAIRMIGANWDVTELAEQNLLLARAELEAVAAGAQYRLLADNSTDMIFIIDRQHKRRFVSPASMELLGYTPRELIGASSPIKVLHPDDAARVTAIITEMFAGRETATSTQRSRHRDGHWVWTDAVFKLVRDPDTGEPLEISGSIRDVTERVAAEAALQESEERYRLLADNSSDAIFVIDRQNIRRYVSPSSREMFGYTPEELTDAVPFVSLTHPEDIAHVQEVCRAMFAGLERAAATARIHHRDGRWIWVDAAFKLIRDPETGEPLQICGALRDITQHVAAEAALRESEERYRLLADNSSDVIVVVTRDFSRRYISPSCRELVGYEADEIATMQLDRLLHPDDHDRVIASRELFAQSGYDRDYITYRLLHRDGHWVWVEAVRRVISYDDDGVPMEICSVLRDISQRVAAEAALRESEGRYRLLLESNVVEAFYMLDPGGTIETWNAGAERIKGYTPEDVIGRNFATFFTPDDVVSGEPARLLATARDSGRVTTEGWRVRKDGSRFLAHVVIDAIHDQDGTLRGFAKVTRDITDQRIEDEQRAIIIEAAPTGMLIVDEVGIITLANVQVERIFDYPSGSLVGRPVEILVPDAVRATHGAMRSAFTEGRSDRAMAAGRAFAGRKRDGSAVSIEILLRQVKTRRGAIVVASLLDVTDRLRLAAEQQEVERLERLAIEANNASLDRLARHLGKARDRAERASLAKTRFLAGMSHELRTPLNGILGYAQLLHLEGGLNAVQAARVTAMLGAGKHLLGMITRVLDLSEIEVDNAQLEVETFDLQPIVEVCLDLIRPATEAKGLTLTFAVAPGTPATLTADVTRLRQVLLNLLGNAAKFTREGGVELRLRRVDDGMMLRIEVVDSGAGIPADQSIRLFQDFERLDTEATRTAEGAGLGLALSARLVTLMGGRIGHADNPGGGSVFWLELPSNLTVAPAAAAGPPNEQPTARILKVLVVDDVMMNRDIASAFLRTVGHDVTFAEGGAEAIAAVTDTDFDVVLMDVRMPGMDGLQATRHIRALPPPRGQVPIVALTAQAFTEQVAACRAAGMDTHLAKPFDVDALLAAVVHAAALRDREAVQAPMPAPASDEPELMVLDPRVFALTAGVLTPDAVASYMKTLLDLADGLVRTLRDPAASPLTDEALAETAHKLAGSAGMFGFDRLAAICRRFERAMQNADAVQAIASELCITVGLTRQAIVARTRVGVSMPAE